MGVSVTNALAKRLEVAVWRDKQVAGIAFEHGDVVQQVVTRPMAGGDRKQGTTVRVGPKRSISRASICPRTNSCICCAPRRC